MGNYLQWWLNIDHFDLFDYNEFNDLNPEIHELINELNNCNFYKNWHPFCSNPIWVGIKIDRMVIYPWEII